MIGLDDVLEDVEVDVDVWMWDRIALAAGGMAHVAGRVMGGVVGRSRESLVALTNCQAWVLWKSSSSIVAIDVGFTMIP